MPSYVVVGASRGLGYAWLQNLSADKANTVIGLARTPASVEKQLDTDQIANVHMLQADMVDHKSLAAAAAKAADLTGGSLDYLIVNGAYLNPKAASITPAGFTGQEDLLREEMEQHMNVNVIGVMFAINAFLPLVRKSGIKKIMVVSTGIADPELVVKTEFAAAVTYGALKAALNFIVIKYSIELKDEGIVVFALSPGVINTSLEPPTEAELAFYAGLFQKLVSVYPHFKGPITAEESVRLQKEVVEKVTIQESGEFLSHFGNKVWV